MCVLVNGEPRLRHESNELRQLRGELLVMRDKVEQLINRLELASFAATSATVAADSDAVPSDGQLLASREVSLTLSSVFCCRAGSGYPSTVSTSSFLQLFA